MLFVLGFVLGFVAGPLTIALLPEQYDPVMKLARWIVSRRSRSDDME